MAKTSKDAEVDALAERMIRVLESQRRLGSEAYPPTLARLAELSGVKASDPTVAKAANKKTFKDRAIVTRHEKKKPSPNAFVILASASDLDRAVEEAAPRFLLTLLDGIAPTKTPAQSIANLAKKLTARIQKPFQQAIKEGMDRGSLPPEVGWLPNGSSKLLFLLSAVQTSGSVAGGRENVKGLPIEPREESREPERFHSEPISPPSQPDFLAGDGDFAPAFRAAFDRLDRQNRSSNFVRLLDLRRALPQFDRARFDAGLRQLRVDQEFTLDSHEGRLRPLTEEEMEGGIREAGSLLVYVSRRT